MGKIRLELESLAKAHGGSITPEQVLEFAEDPDTALHKRFCWDDTEAAHQYRLAQARQIIRVTVTVRDLPQHKTRVFVNLKDDRPKSKYRLMVDVMDSPDLRDQLLDTALSELESFRRKYDHLEELAEIFDAVARLAKSRTAKGQRAKRVVKRVVSRART